VSALDLLFKRWNPVYRVYERLMLSKAKHRSLAGHPKTALRFSRLVKAYGFDERHFFDADQAPADVAARRRAALDRLEGNLKDREPKSLAATEEMIDSVSDLDFVNRYRVPFQFRDYVSRRLKVANVVVATDGVKLQDADGNWTYDIGGSYGVNVFGTTFYKRNIEKSVERARDVGLMLGAYHPSVADNVRRLKAISGMDEVSFHMSGTEAVMQAVRLCRYHTGKTHAVRFSGAYHGWWDGVQVGPGNPLPSHNVYTLTELSQDSLRVLRMRTDIACVLINPIQALAPNAAPAGDSGLVAGTRSASFDKAGYTAWLKDLRAVCTEKGIPLIFDEVFLGFRLAKGGVQEYFGVKADLVTYGKTLGGGYPVGVLCGSHALMHRYREDKPTDVCFARGTFNSHPYVMTAMNEFLLFIETPQAEATWRDLDERWNARAARLNAMLGDAGTPVRVANLASIFTTLYTSPGRYHWMLQYYLRDKGLSLSWIGSGRYIFSHDFTDGDFDEVCRRFVAAAKEMLDGGWFWAPEGATAKSINRQITGEIWEAIRGRRRRPQLGAGPQQPPTESLPASLPEGRLAT
jgi:glutamate-1-semialdehyde 2,1-aminomutase